MTFFFLIEEIVRKIRFISYIYKNPDEIVIYTNLNEGNVILSIVWV